MDIVVNDVVVNVVKIVVTGEIVEVAAEVVVAVNIVDVVVAAGAVVDIAVGVSTVTEVVPS